MNLFNALTTETQVCVVIALVLIVIMLAGMCGYRVGWMRCVEYVESLNMKGVQHD